MVNTTKTTPFATHKKGSTFTADPQAEAAKVKILPLIPPSVKGPNVLLQKLLSIILYIYSNYFKKYFMFLVLIFKVK